MITNFEDITFELTDAELNVLPIILKGFSTHNESNPIKAPEIIKASNNYFKDKKIDFTLTEPRLRKMANYIRSTSLLPLVATSKGYFITQNKDIIRSQIRSLEERSNSILNCVNGLKVFIKE